MAIAAVAGLSSALSAAAYIGFQAITFAQFATAFAIGAGLSMVSRALAPKPNLGAQLRGITETTRNPAGPRQIVYGQIRVGGQIVYIQHSGTNNEFLHLVIVFAAHEIESFEEFWFNDFRAYENGAVTSDWTGYVTVTTFDGSQTTADETLVSAFSEWTDNHVLNDMAYAHFKLKWDQDKFPQGVPNITAIVKGKKVYDPRESGHSATDDTTWTYSDNPALCVRDYLVDKKYGLGEDHTLIDETALTAAANLCDEDVALNGGGTHTRYECNGVMNTDNQIKSNIEQILSAMGGSVSYSGGKYFIDAAGVLAVDAGSFVVGTKYRILTIGDTDFTAIGADDNVVDLEFTATGAGSGTGTAYLAPTIEFTEADCVSDIQTQTKQSRRGAYNGVKGIFVSQEKNYKVLDYPAQISSSYEDEDGDPIYLDMPLPFVTDNRQAQRLAKIALLKSRQQVVVTMTVNLKGLQVKVGDTIKLTNERLGYDEKIFEVIDYSLAINSGGDLAVNVQLIETAAAIYDWATSDEQDFLSGGVLDLYDGRTVNNVTNLAKSEIALLGPDGATKTTTELTWTAPDDAFIDFYKVRYNVNGTTNYFHAETKEPRILLSGLDVTQNYDFRVQVQNLLGVTSTGATLLNKPFTGDTTAPSPVTNVEITSGLKNLTVQWTNPTDADLAYVQIYVASSITKPASPVAQINGTEFVYPAASGEGKGTIKYFWLEAVDFSGNVSTTVGPEYESIQLPKSEEIDGAVSEAITFGIYNALSTTLSTSLTTFGSFSTPAPESDVKKRALLMAMFTLTANNPSGDFTVGVRVERKSKGATTGTSLGTVVANDGVAQGARYIEVAGNVMAELDMYGGIATSATSPSAVYNVVSVEYQTSTDRTRIIYASSTVISSGDIYYNADKWTSAGTWLTYAPLSEPRYNVLGITGSANHFMFQPLSASDSEEDYRVRAKYYHLTSGTATMGVGLAGQIQFTR
jgi:hypothetical protein